MQRAELHVHTTLSEDISVIQPEAAIWEALIQGCPAIAFVDKNSVQCFPSVAKCQRKYGEQIKILYGTETEADDDCVVLLVRDDEGFRALNRVLTTHKLTRAQREHLWVGAGPNSRLYRALNEGADPACLQALCARYDYIEVVACSAAPLNQALYTLGKAQGIPVVAVGNCHHLTPEDRVSKQIADNALDRDADAPDTHFCTTQEMLDAFAYLGQDAAYEVVVIAPNSLVASIAVAAPYPKKLPPFTLPDAHETVSRLCREALVTRYGLQPPADISQRLEEELSLLQPGTHASLYLLSHELSRHLHQQGVMTGCRGTQGSTLMAYLLEISDINPLPAHYLCPQCRRVEFTEADSGFDLPERVCPTCGAPMNGDGHNLPFETAMGYEGEREPDVNLTIPEAAYPEALRFLSAYLGQGRVAFGSTVSRLFYARAAGALDDYAQKHDLTFTQEEHDHHIQLLEQVRRQSLRAPGILLLLPEGASWEELSPLRRLTTPVGDMDVMAQISYLNLVNSVTRISLLKYSPFDQLQELHQSTGVKPEEISYNDPQVYQLLEEQDTGGLPELETNFMHEVLGHFDSFRFGNLARINGMVHGTEVWTGNGEVLLEQHPLQALISTRDDLFLALQRYGMSRKDAYAVTTAVRLGRFRREHPHNPRLLHAMEQAGVPDWYVQSLRRVAYLFPKAHTVLYTKTTMALAWFKRYYPADFYRVTLQQAACAPYLACTNRELEHQLSEMDPTYPYHYPDKEALLLVLEARRKGYAPEPVN